MHRVLRVLMLLDVLPELKNDLNVKSYTLQIDEAFSGRVHVEEGFLCVVAIGQAVLSLFVLDLPDLPQDYAPQDHVLDHGLLLEDLSQLSLSLEVFARSR